MKFQLNNNLNLIHLNQGYLNQHNNGTYLFSKIWWSINFIEKSGTYSYVLLLLSFDLLIVSHFLAIFYYRPIHISSIVKLIWHKNQTSLTTVNCFIFLLRFKIKYFLIFHMISSHKCDLYVLFKLFVKLFQLRV